MSMVRRPARPTCCSSSPTPDVSRRILDTPIGALTITTTAAGVCEVRFGTVAEIGDLDDGMGARANIARAERELGEYFSGARTRFGVPLDRSARRGFRGEVLDALERVEFGNTVTYGLLAERAGRPRAARAVGTAMATNPIAVLVPCHRVLPSTGGVGHYAGTSAVKQYLLTLEGVTLA